jgi:hypothetical protein
MAMHLDEEYYLEATAKLMLKPDECEEDLLLICLLQDSIKAHKVIEIETDYFGIRQIRQYKSRQLLPFRLCRNQR